MGRNSGNKRQNLLKPFNQKEKVPSHMPGESLRVYDSSKGDGVVKSLEEPLQQIALTNPKALSTLGFWAGDCYYKLSMISHLAVSFRIVTFGFRVEFSK